MAFEMTGYSDNKRVFFLDKIIHLDIKLIDQLDELPREKYQVVVNMLSQFLFQYNPEKRAFYIDCEDSERAEQQNEEHAKLCEGKTVEEQKEMLKDKFVSYIKRQEFVIKC